MSGTLQLGGTNLAVHSGSGASAKITLDSGLEFPALGNSAVGTVSQTGGATGDPGTGTPTGHIIEEGHTSQGTYIKFANGTMICTNFMSASIAFTTGYGYSYLGSDTNASNHPATFASVTGIGHAVTSSSGGRAYVSNVTVTNTQITSVHYQHPNTQTSLGVTTQFIIYGTWY